MMSDEAKRIVEKLRAQPLCDVSSLLEMRAQYERNAVQLDRADVECTGFEAHVPMEWIGRSPRSLRRILYLHGGGYVMGSLATHRNLTARLAREAGASALAVEYRLAPEHPHPAAIDDAFEAYRFMLSDTSPERVAIAGDSCGAGLALAVMLRAREHDVPLPSAFVAFSPWVDLALEGASIRSRAAIDPCVTEKSLRDMACAYLGEQDPRAPSASPLYADLRGLPPTLIQVGTNEVLFDDARRLADRAQRAGVSIELEIWDDMFHVWQAYVPELPEAQQALERAGAFLRERVRD